MLVAVTGSGGNLGRSLLPELLEAGHDVRTLDLRSGDVVGDVRDPDAVARVMEGVDAVVHAAALHGVHLALRPVRDFWETNATGTLNVYEAARESGVRHVVLCSTMGVYGRRLREATVIDDWSPVAPADVYALTKAVCEEIAAAYARSDGISTVALRLGMFVPESWERYGFRLLWGGVDDRDVATVVRLALEHEPAGGFDAMNAMATVPFDDPLRYARDPAALIEEHWPGTRDLGFDVAALVHGACIWRCDKARGRLGWVPRFGFDEFLEAHRRGERGHYPSADPSQWGLAEEQG